MSLTIIRLSYFSCVSHDVSLSLSRESSLHLLWHSRWSLSDTTTPYAYISPIRTLVYVCKCDSTFGVVIALIVLIACVNSTHTCYRFYMCTCVRGPKWQPLPKLLDNSAVHFRLLLFFTFFSLFFYPKCVYMCDSFNRRERWYIS